MKKIKFDKILKKYAIFMLIIIFISNIVPPLQSVVAYADDTEETKSSDEDSEDSSVAEGQGMNGANVLGSNVKNTSVFTEYSKYDKRVQFAITYNILLDSLGSGTNYSNAIKGSGLNKNLPFQFKNEIVGGTDSLSSIIREDTAGEGTEDIADNSNEDIKKIVEESMGSELNKASEELAKGMVNYKKGSIETVKDEEDMQNFYNKNWASVSQKNEAIMYATDGNFSATTTGETKIDYTSTPISSKEITNTVKTGMVIVIANLLANPDTSDESKEESISDLLNDTEVAYNSVYKEIWGKGGTVPTKGTVLAQKYKYDNKETSFTSDGSIFGLFKHDFTYYKASPTKGKFTEGQVADSFAFANKSKRKDDSEAISIAKDGYIKETKKLNDKVSKLIKDTKKNQTPDAKGSSENSKIGTNNFKGLSWTNIIADGDTIGDGKARNESFFFYNNGKDENDDFSNENQPDYYIGGSTGKKAGGKDKIGGYLGKYKKKARYDKNFKSKQSLTRTSNNVLTSIALDSGAVKGFAGGKFENEKDMIGIDNYGNIIETKTGIVLVPYWKNSTLDEYKDFQNYMSTNILNGIENKELDKVQSSVGNILGTVEGSAELETAKDLSKKIKNMSTEEVANLLDDAQLTDGNAVNEAVSLVSSLQTSADVSNVMVNNLRPKTSTSTDADAGLDGSSGKTDSTRENFAKNMALIITIGTGDQVEKYNKRYIESVRNTNNMYISLGNGGEDDGVEKDDLARFTAAGLIQKIGIMFEVGFGNLLRLTIASRTVSMYNSDFMSYGLNSIFYTGTVFESSKVTELIEGLSLWLMTIVGFLILFWLFSKIRGTMTWKDMAKAFVLASLTLVIPLGYGKVIDVALNKPASMMVGQQLKQTSILDFWVNNNLDFGDDKDKEEMTKYFYGMTDTSEKTKLIMKNRKLDYTLYFPTTLLKSNGADVTSDDIEDSLSLIQRARYQSVKDKSTGINWGKNDLQRAGVSSFDLKEWAEEMADKSNDKVTPLFEWLVENKNEDNLYSDLTADGGYVQEMPLDMNKYFNDQQKSVQKKEDTTSGYKGTGSMLFLEVYRNLMKNADFESLGNVQKVMSKTEVMNNGKKATLSVDAKETFLNDLSKTLESRKTIYGSEDSSKIENADNPFAPSTMVMANDVGMTKMPENDFLGIESTVNTLVPYRSMSEGQSLNADIFDINRKFLNKYISDYSKVRQSISPDANFDKAESFAMSLETFFILNKQFKIKLLPTGYEPKTMSFDSYVRMAFIPMGEFNPTNPYTSNVAGYLAEKEQSLPLILFMIALLMLVIFGYVYLLVFYVVLVVVVIAVFFYNYVIKTNIQNESWKGMLWIIGAFALVKAGLMAIWWAFNTYLNYSYNTYGGVTIPYVMIFSVVIIAYITWAFLKVFMKVFKAVKQDFSNLGANAFREEFGRLKGVTARGLAKSGFGGAKNMASKPYNMAKWSGRAIKRVHNGEGRLGKLSDRSKNSLRRSANKIAIRTGLADAKDNIDMVSLKNRMKQAPLNGALKNKWARGIARNLPSATLQAMANSIDSRKFANNVVDSKSEKILNSLAQGTELGEALSTNVHDKITNFTYENKETAKLMQGYFESEGYNVSRDGNNLAVNTKGLDITHMSDRARLYENANDYLTVQSQNVKGKLFNRTSKLGKREGIYDYTELGNGKVQLKIGGQDGLTREAFEELMNNSAFYKNFKLEDGFDINKLRGMDGYIRDNTYITLDKLKSSKKDMESAVRSLYKSDNTVRENLGLGRRKFENPINGNNKKLQLAKKGQNSDIKSFLDNNGIKLDSNMRVQDGQILYNQDNNSNVKIIESIRKKMNEEGRQKDKLIKNASSNVLSALMDEDSQAGFRSSTVRAGDEHLSDRDKKLMDKLGISRNGGNIKTTVLNTKNKDIGDKVTNAVKSLSELGKPENSKDLVNYALSKKEGISIATDFLTKTSKGSNDYESGFRSLRNIVKNNNGIPEKTLMDYSDRFEALQRDRNSLSDTLFNKKNKELYSDLINSIKDSPRQDSIYLDVLADASKKDVNYQNIAEKFRDSRLSLVEKTGISQELLNQVNSGNVRSIGSLSKGVEDIGDIDAKGSTISINTNKDGEDALKLIEKIIKNESSNL